MPGAAVRRLTTVAGGAVAALAAALLATTTLTAASASPAVAGLVRVDQVGFLPGEVKQAYLMTPVAVSGAKFKVIDAYGATVLAGTVGKASRGSWNASYPDVYPMTFSGLHAPGSYHIVVSGAAHGTSPTFRIESAATLYGSVLRDGVAFFQVQRDGPDVIAGALGRQPSHLHDAHATVYAHPHFLPDGDDVIQDANLTAIGGPVNVSGGWFDAGDYLKFTHTTAFGDAILYASARALGSSAPASLVNEARFGEDWLDKVWDQATKTLYMQVGIGSGNDAG